MPKTISIHTVSRKLIIRVNLNGVPIAYDIAGKGIEVNDQANEWVRKGRNVLDVTIDWPGNVPFAPAVAKATIEVRILSAGADPSATEPVAAIKWPGSEPESYPRRLQAEFTLADFPDLRLWHECETISEISEFDRSSIATLLGKLHSAYERGDAGQVCEILAIRLEDVAVAFGDEKSELSKDTQETVKNMAATDGWALMDLNPQSLEYELIAEKRLVWVTGPAKAPALCSKRMKTFRWSMHTYLGRIGGVWKIVR